MKIEENIMENNTMEENLFLASLSLKKAKFLTENLFDYFKSSDPNLERLFSDYENCRICTLLLIDEIAELMEELEYLSKLATANNGKDTQPKESDSLQAKLQCILLSSKKIKHLANRLLHYFSAPSFDVGLLQNNYEEHKIGMSMLIDEIMKMCEMAEQLQQVGVE